MARMCGPTSLHGLISRQGIISVVLFLIRGCGRFLGDWTKGLSYVRSRGTTARGGLVFRHADDQVVEHLGYPTRQCLERWLAVDPRYAGHMTKPIIPLETRTKAIEPVPGGMAALRPKNRNAGQTTKPAR